MAVNFDELVVKLIWSLCSLLLIALSLMNVKNAEMDTTGCKLVTPVEIFHAVRYSRWIWWNFHLNFQNSTDRNFAMSTPWLISNSNKAQVSNCNINQPSTPASKSPPLQADPETSLVMAKAISSGLNYSPLNPFLAWIAASGRRTKKKATTMEREESNLAIVHYRLLYLHTNLWHHSIPKRFSFSCSSLLVSFSS